LSTPEPPVSVADSVTVTEATYAVLPQAALLQVIVVVGGTVSAGAWMTWVLVASILPA
jgi:hypothetical protein